MFLPLLEIAASWRQSFLPVPVKARYVLKRIREVEMSPECLIGGTVFRVNENPVSAGRILRVGCIPYTHAHVVLGGWGGCNAFDLRIQRPGIRDYIPVVVPHSPGSHNTVSALFRDRARFLANTNVFAKRERFESCFLSAGIQYIGKVFFQAASSAAGFWAAGFDTS
jgi:hypothetical protein